MLTAGRSAAAVIAALDLAPLPGEGGFFRETWRGEEVVPGPALPAHRADRSVGTSILFLITPDAFSALHVLTGPEVWFFHDGDPAELTLLHPGGRCEIVTLGHDLAAGHVPQVVVAGGVWQACSVAPGGAWSLFGTAMAPGFDVGDFTLGDAATLETGWPEAAARIRRLTRG